MKKLLLALLLSSLFVTSAVAADYSDIDAHWGKDAILEVGHLFSDYEDGTFRPDQPMSRGEFLSLAVNSLLMGSDMETPDPSAMESYYNLARDMAIIPSFFHLGNLDTEISRDEMAYIVFFTTGHGEFQVDRLIHASVIKDYSQIASYYRLAVKFTYSLGIISGDSDGNFNPHNPVSRAEAAVVFRNLTKPEFRMTPDFTGAPEAGSLMATALLPKNILNFEFAQSREPLTLDYADPYRPMAAVGDTMMIDGVAHPVIPHPLAPVNHWGTAIPYVEGVALDLGIDTDLARTVVYGFQSIDHYANGFAYYVNPWTGEGHWQPDWMAICAASPAPTTEGTHLEISDDGLWVWDDALGRWNGCYNYYSIPTE